MSFTYFYLLVGNAWIKIKHDILLLTGCISQLISGVEHKALIERPQMFIAGATLLNIINSGSHVKQKN